MVAEVVSPLLCTLGLHTWDHCRCARCGAFRDERHEWDGLCTCAVCGKTRNAFHQRAACRCRVCGAEVHDFAPDGSRRHTCRSCGVSGAHSFARELRWEDWGGWDSTGPWRAQENEYLVCRQCGCEEYVGPTGRIQV